MDYIFDKFTEAFIYLFSSVSKVIDIIAIEADKTYQGGIK